MAFLLINAGLNYLYNATISARLDNGIKLTALKNYKGELKYLHLGSSHSQNGINPVLIDSGFNFSAALENCIQSYYKLKACVEKLDKKPEYITIPVDLSTFSQFRANRFKQVSSLLTLSDYLEIYRLTGDRKYLKLGIHYKFFNYSGKNEIIRKYLKTRRTVTNPKLEFGFKGRKGVLTKDFPEGADAECVRKAHMYFDEGSYWNTDLVLYFDMILDYCRQNNIKVIGIKMPLAKKYIETCNTLFSIEEFNTRVDSLFSAYQGNAWVLNFRNLFEDKPEYFWNPDHLNVNGATVFSPTLKARLDSLDQALKKMD